MSNWSNEDVAELMRLAPSTSIDELTKRFGRSKGAIEAKLRLLNYMPRWKLSEDAKLRKMIIDGAKIDEIKLEFNHYSYNEIVHRIRFIALFIPNYDESKSEEKWSKDDVSFLRENAKLLSFRELSSYLRRPVDEIHTKCVKMLLLTDEDVLFRVEYEKKCWDMKEWELKNDALYK